MTIIKQEITTKTTVVVKVYMDGEEYIFTINYSQTQLVGGEIIHREVEFISVNGQSPTIKNCGGSEDSQMHLADLVDKELVKEGLVTL